MPIENLSDTRRLTRDFKIRLGERRTRGDGGVRGLTPEERRSGTAGYPSEVDYFVMQPDEVPEDVRTAYGRTPRSLRMMLPMEWDARRVDTGEELVFNLNNRAYLKGSGLRCKGTGLNAEYPGTATTTDQEWATRIAKATESDAERITSPTGPRYQVRCLGADCPKYLKLVPGQKNGNEAMVRAEGVDQDATCKRVAILRAFLLHPDSNEVLGVAEIASGSYNTMVDLQSGFDMMRPFTGGRTAGVPFTLVRKTTTTYKPSRQVHWTLAVRYNVAELQRFAAVPLHEVFLGEDLRAQLRQIAATPLAPNWDSVRDLHPTLPGGLLAEHTDSAAQEADITPTEAPAPSPGDPRAMEEGDAILTRSQLTKFKHLAGQRVDPDGPEDDRRNPWEPEAIARLQRAVDAYNQEHGTSVRRLVDITHGMTPWLATYLGRVAQPDAAPDHDKLIEGTAREVETTAPSAIVSEDVRTPLERGEDALAAQPEEDGIASSELDLGLD